MQHAQASSSSTDPSAEAFGTPRHEDPRLKRRRVTLEHRQAAAVQDAARVAKHLAATTLRTADATAPTAAERLQAVRDRVAKRQADNAAWLSEQRMATGYP